MRVIPTFYIKTEKTKNEIIYIFKQHTQDMSIMSITPVPREYSEYKNRQFFLGDINITGDEFFLRRNNFWHDEIGIKIIDNNIDRTIRYQLGAGDTLRIIFILCLIIAYVIAGILDKVLNNSMIPYHILLGLGVIIPSTLASIQRIKAEKAIKSKIENLFSK